MLSREYQLKLNDWVVKFTGNASGSTPYGNLSTILTNAFPTDQEIKPFLIRAYAQSPAWLFLLDNVQGKGLTDFNGKQYDRNILTSARNVYKLPNKIGWTIYAVDPSSVNVSNTANLPDYLQGREGTQEYFDYIKTQQAGFSFDNNTALIALGLLVLGLFVFQK